MRSTSAAAALLLALLILAACDKPAPGYGSPPVTTDPTGAPAPPGPAQPLSAGLTRRAEAPGSYLDHIGAVVDPVNKGPAVVAADAPAAVDGFAFDPVAKAPARGVDVAVDGKLYAAAYGGPRGDVAVYFKVPALTPVGFTLTLPPAALARGEHVLTLRVIAADGAGYFEAAPVRFQAR